MDPAQVEANVNLEKALRRANLLAAAAEVSQNITQILDIDELLPKTVDIICDAYGFYYAGVFLIDETGEYAVLRAGRGEPGRIMMENNHKLAVGGNSMIGACTSLNEARISLDVDTEKVWYPNPVLPETRSEMALPLAIGDRVIGAVTVQSTEGAAFSDEDVSSLQAMANQLAIAIDNASQRRELEETHAELVRAKTFEAIAAATGDAIHWIGNKAEPIHSSVERVRYDLKLMVCAVADLFEKEPATGQSKESHPLVELLVKEAANIEAANPDITAAVENLNKLSSAQMKRQLDLASIFEDLQIIDEAATLIMRVKEDLIGPAREHAPRATMVDDVVKDAVSILKLPEGIVSIESDSDVPLAMVDSVQLNRVVVNLVKNAYEAMENQPQPQIQIKVNPDEAGEFVALEVIDNGAGIPSQELDKIWITFHTTKGIREHPGLGLPACRLILEQIGGHISATSQPGQGSTFTVKLPIYQGQEAEDIGQESKGKILIIDDSDRWQQFAGAALGKGGYKVSTSGKDYSVDKPAQYDLILVDDILAEGDSLDILERIKRAGAIAHTLVVSSNPRVERTKERKLLGVLDLRPKPYTRASLLSAVKSALGSIH